MEGHNTIFDAFAKERYALYCARMHWWFLKNPYVWHYLNKAYSYLLLKRSGLENKNPTWKKCERKTNFPAWFRCKRVFYQFVFVNKNRQKHCSESSESHIFRIHLRLITTNRSNTYSAHFMCVRDFQHLQCHKSYKRCIAHRLARSAVHTFESIRYSFEILMIRITHRKEYAPLNALITLPQASPAIIILCIARLTANHMQVVFNVNTATNNTSISIEVLRTFFVFVISNSFDCYCDNWSRYTFNLIEMRPTNFH